MLSRDHFGWVEIGENLFTYFCFKDSFWIFKYYIPTVIGTRVADLIHNYFQIALSLL